jgi:FtsH-binding integral membrane protein
MNRPNLNKSPTPIGLAALATILSTIAAIGGTLMLQPLREIFQTLGTKSVMSQLIFGLQPLLWFGPWLSPLVGWLNYQQKLSSRAAIAVLFSIISFAIGYTIVSIISLYGMMFKVFDSLG